MMKIILVHIICEDIMSTRICYKDIVSFQFRQLKRSLLIIIDIKKFIYICIFVFGEN